MFQLTHNNRFPSLDGVRAIATLMIVIYHCFMFSGWYADPAAAGLHAVVISIILKGAWIAIDVFFTLSGFLIGRILIQSMEDHGHLQYKRFMIRRSFRVFPAYYAILLITTFGLVYSPIFHWMFHSNSPELLQSRSWSNFLYVSNYMYPGRTPNLFSWGWSLCVEEHFYLILPLLLWLLFKTPTRWHIPLTLGAISLPIVGRAIQYLMDPDTPLWDGFYYYSHNHFDELLMGVFLAYLYVHHRPRLEEGVRQYRYYLWLIAICCWGSIWAFGSLEHSNAFTKIWQFFCAAIGTTVLLTNCIFLPNTLTRVLARRMWYPLARVSYSFYLIHPFCLFLFLYTYRSQYPLEQMPLWIFAFSCVWTISATWFCSASLFILLEKPMLKLGYYLSDR